MVFFVTTIPSTFPVTSTFTTLSFLPDAAPLLLPSPRQPSGERSGNRPARWPLSAANRVGSTLDPSFQSGIPHDPRKRPTGRFVCVTCVSLFPSDHAPCCIPLSAYMKCRHLQELAVESHRRCRSEARSINSKKKNTMCLHRKIKTELSICQCLLRLNTLSFPVLGPDILRPPLLVMHQANPILVSVSELGTISCRPHFRLTPSSFARNDSGSRKVGAHTASWQQRHSKTDRVFARGSLRRDTRKKGTSSPTSHKSSSGDLHQLTIRISLLITAASPLGAAIPALVRSTPHEAPSVLTCFLGLPPPETLQQSQREIENTHADGEKDFGCHYPALDLASLVRRQEATTPEPLPWDLFRQAQCLPKDKRTARTRDCVGKRHDVKF